MKVDNLLPEVYYKESRDFSYIGRLFEIVFNYMKMQADLVPSDSGTESANSNILELTAKTIGFETKHKYINKDLAAVVNNFTSIIKQKGTKEAIIHAATLLSSCHQLNVDEDRLVVDSILDKDGKETVPEKTLIITLPYGSKDTILFEDLLNYILPAGWLYELNYADIARSSKITTITAKNVTDGAFRTESIPHDDITLGQVVSTTSSIDTAAHAGSTTPLYTWTTGVVVAPHPTVSEASEEAQPDASETPDTEEESI